MTPKAFDAPLTLSGKNSYRILVEAARGRNRNPNRLLDLACGDGHLVRYVREEFGPAPELVGVDMSEGELAAARSRNRGPGISFKCESAGSISEPDQSFDLVLCHMAFMLMNPIEPVVAEVARLLKAGGVFAGVVGGGPAKAGFLLTYRKILGEFMKSRFPDYKPAPMGDSRARTAGGIKELLCAPAFGAVEVSDFEVLVKASPEGTWAFFEDMYNVSLLPAGAREELKHELVSQAKAALNHGEAEITFEFPMRLFAATRA